MTQDQQDADLLLSTHGSDGILRLTLNDPNRRNALSEAMLGALGKVFDAASANSDIRVIILAAHGPVFCAGHDLKEMTAGRQNADQGACLFHQNFTSMLICYAENCHLSKTGDC